MLQSRCASESKRPLSVLLRSGWYRSRPRTSLRSPDAADHTIESGAAAAAPAPTQTQELATAASRRRQRVGPIAGPERPSSIVRPRIGISRKRIARKRNWRSAAQPARAGLSAGGARRSAPPRARTREIRANKVNAVPNLKRWPFSAACWRVTPYLAALAPPPTTPSNPAPRRPHQPQPKLRWRPAAAAPPRRPEPVAPPTDAAIAAAPNRIERKWNRRRIAGGGRSRSRCRPRARESMDKEEERAASENRSLPHKG